MEKNLEEALKEVLEVKTTRINSKKYFYGKELFLAMGFANPLDIIRKYCKGSKMKFINTAGGKQRKKVVPEDDVLTLIQNSKRFNVEEKKAYIEGLRLCDYVFVYNENENSFFYKLKKKIECFSKVQKDLFGEDVLVDVEMLEQHSIVCKSGKKYTLDCYLPDYNVIIEYRKYFGNKEHSNKHRDIDFNEYFKDVNGKPLDIVRVKRSEEIYWLEYIVQLLDVKN